LLVEEEEAFLLIKQLVLVVELEDTGPLLAQVVVDQQHFHH
jgi:hypothetical protein